VGFKSTGRRAPAFAPLVLALLGGCWSKTNNSLPDAVALCNDLQYGSSFVQAMNAENGTAPAPTGGAMTGGSYHLTSSTFYPLVGCAVDPVATVLQVSASSPTSGTIQTASLTSTGYILSESTSYLVNDTSLQVHIDCVVPDSAGLLGTGAQIYYSATPTEIQLYATGGCGNHIEVYDLD
jgi:hypothetical protein